MNQFMIEGRSMAYRDVGQGPVLLLGHSFLWHSGMWQQQVETLSQHYRCIVPDFWAHGESESAPSSMHNLGDYAQHMLALMDYLNVDMFSIVGLSAGGMWGAELAVLAPTRVTSLVLLDTFVGLEPEVAFNKYKVMLDSVDDLQKIPEAIRSSVLALSYSERVRHDKPELIGQLDELLVDVKGDQARQLAAIGRMVFGRRDLCEEVEKLVLPTLIAVGDQDKPTPVLEAYLMNDLISGSEINVIPNSGHLSVVEQPEYVTVMLEAFFSKHLS